MESPVFWFGKDIIPTQENIHNVKIIVLYLQECQAVVNMLCALCSATATSYYREQLQSDTELLKTTISE